MKQILFIVILILTISCAKNKRTEDNKIINRTIIKKQALPVKSDTIINVVKPTVITVSLDTTEIDLLRHKYGDGDFYTATDDAMNYNAQMQERMDSLKIPVLYTEKKNIAIKTASAVYRVQKDTLAVYSYYFFDGDSLTKKEVFDLLNYK